MSEYIIEVPDEEAELFIARFGINGTTMFGYQLVDEIVRCRDCKFGVDGGKYCAEGCADSWDWRNVEPNGFCAWATCKCGEDIETNGFERVVCPSCGRVITE